MPIPWTIRQTPGCGRAKSESRHCRKQCTRKRKQTPIVAARVLALGSESFCAKPCVCVCSCLRLCGRAGEGVLE